MKHKKTFYDLAGDHEKAIAAAEKKHCDILIVKELTATREAVQSLCSLMMAFQINNSRSI